MADAYVQVAPNSTGSKVDTTQLTVGANTVDRQRFVVSGGIAAELADVKNAAPTTEYGLVVRNIPSGTQAVSAASLPLPTDAATQTTLAALNTKVTAVNTGAVVLAAGAAIAGKVGIDQTTPGTTNLVQVGGSLPAGTAYVGKVRLTDGTNDAVVETPATFTVGIVATTKGQKVVAMAHQMWPVANGGDDKLYPQNMNSSGHTLASIAGIGESAVSTNNGTADAGCQRVVIASSNSDIPMKIQPQTAGGLSRYRLLSAATTNGNNIKASAGQVYAFVLANTTATVKFVKLYNKATAPTVGTDTPVETYMVPASSNLVINLVVGGAFATGIGIGITALVADSDTTAVAANDVVVDLFYK